MEYTASQLAQSLGTTTRALRHYEEAGLLQPERKANGYRVYTEQQILLAQQIIEYRNLGFSIEEITFLLDAPTDDIHAAMMSKREELTEAQNSIEETIDTLEEHMNTQHQTNEQIAEEADKHNEQYREEAYATYDPQLVQQSQERFANWSTDKKAAVIKEGKMIVQQMADQMQAGVAADSPEVQQLTAAYHKHMNNFYDCSMEIFAGLGEMYVENPQFTQYYEKVAPGLAEYVRSAIREYTKKSDK